MRGVRERIQLAAAAALLAAPVALAFLSGGYFDEPRLWGALGACAVLGVAAAFAPLPRAWPVWTALGSMAGLAALSALSRGWAPLSTPAVADAERVTLYAAAFGAGAMLLRGRARSWVEPALAATCALVIAYALGERLLPGVLEYARSRSAAGRLEQPLTYWNAMGSVAALGLVLAVRLAGDAARRAPIRGAAAACGPLLMLGLALTFSRGALASAAVGLAVLAWLEPTRAQLRALAVVLTSGAAATAVALPLDWVRALDAGAGDPPAQGGVALGILAIAGVSAAWFAPREGPGPRLRRPRAPVAVAALALACALFVAAAVATDRGRERAIAPTGATVERLASAQSNRYEYWRVGLAMVADDPLRGGGAGAFRWYWRKDRPRLERTLDAHSLPLETAAELGIMGLALLVAAATALGAAAVRARRRTGPAAAGAIALLAAFALHASIDWLWEMPAVTLIALLAAASLTADS